MPLLCACVFAFRRCAGHAALREKHKLTQICRSPPTRSIRLHLPCVHRWDAIVNHVLFQLYVCVCVLFHTYAICVRCLQLVCSFSFTRFRERHGRQRWCLKRRRMNARNFVSVGDNPRRSNTRRHYRSKLSRADCIPPPEGDAHPWCKTASGTNRQERPYQPRQKR